MDKIEPTRTVRFVLDKNDETSTVEKTSAPPLTPESCRELWYEPHEIDGFKKEARDLVLYGGTGAGDDLCGLERFSFERSKQKRRVLRYVIYMQKQRKEAEFLRIVSKKLTAWARDAAVSQGFADFCQVYDPLESLLGDSCENYNDSFFNENGKRNMVEESSQCFITEDRHVRPCLSRAISA